MKLTRLTIRCAFLLLTAMLLGASQGAIAAPQEEDQDEQETAAEPAGDEEAAEQEGEDEKPKLTAGTFSCLNLRSIGPALMSGRVGDFAVNPRDPAEYFVAVCSGGLWKTSNAGTTWKPVFDGQGSYSIGCVTLDPTNTNVVWVGTGENNSQRSVAFGDGVYKSVDGGKSFKNVGLRESEHIGMITVHPHDPNVVYVAAQGPLWRSGGDRGLYLTRDGGKTWECILHISDDTGVNEIHMDPLDPNILYASAYQRRRHVWTLIDGGPESALYKSEDGGKSWRKLTRGLPGGDIGRIGVDISPADPDVLYAIVEAAGDGGGVFRSTDRGETWEKRSGYMSTSPQYYNELVCDPLEVDRCYSLDTALKITEDGGRTWSNVPGRGKHVDNHALWIDPRDTDHLLVGCDGGVYESWDRGAAWDFKENLPVTQFYRVAVDTSEPFYFVYGGTQDNNTLGGPSRTLDRSGSANEDWFVTVGGDGFEPAVDPTDPNIVYSQWQYAGLVRYDRRSGERIDIKPQEAPGEPPLHWNWDSPLIISPHSPTRLYFGANILFRSDDRGDNWRAVSGDLTRQIDRDRLKVMGKIQRPEAVSKHRSTSVYGNIVALDESPLAEGLLYAGTDDGLVQVTAAGGGAWEKIESFPGVPELSYVSFLKASLHDADTVFAAFDNHKMGDFTPYLLKSTDRGKTWVSIAGDLPERNIVYAVGQDHVLPDLLFAGTEFGLYVTLNGGEKWLRLKNGLPTIAVRDLEIQRRENDVVLATFGRGFYVLDDYTPLRHVTEERLTQEEAFFCPIKDALLYIQTGSGRGSQGSTFYRAENPPFGATFTYYLKDKLMTRKEIRLKAERDAEKEIAAARKRAEEDARKGAEEAAKKATADEAKKAGEEVKQAADVDAEQGAETAGEAAAAAEPVPAAAAGEVQGGATPPDPEQEPAGAEPAEPQRPDNVSQVEWADEESVPYPTFDELRAEDREVAPSTLLTIRDAAGQIVRRIKASRSEGLHRVAWDLRHTGAGPVSPGSDGGGGPLVVPGTYTVTLSRVVDGVVTDLAGPEPFVVRALDLATIRPQDAAEVLAFRLEAQRLNGAVQGAIRVANDASDKLAHMKAAFLATPGADPALLARAHELGQRLADIRTELTGDRSLSSREAPTPLSISDRVGGIIGSQWSTTSPPTGTDRAAFRYAGTEFERVLGALRAFVEEDLRQLEEDLAAAGAPWTPGRMPEWKMK